jgi:hypothetical protein
LSSNEFLELELSVTSYKNISQDKIDTILANVMLGNSRYSNRTLFKIVKAFTYNILKNMGEDDMKVLVVPTEIVDKETGMENSVGAISGDKILLSMDHVLELRTGQFDVINTIFHECRHVYQNKLLRDLVINYDTYRLSVDCVLREVFSEEYYQNNYDHLFLEVDAEIVSSVETYNYLKKIVPNLSSSLYDDTKDYIRRCSNDLKISEREVSNQKFDYDATIDEIMECDPDYTFLFPVLSFYYKETGAKVTVAEILSRRLEQSTDVESSSIIKELRKLDLTLLKHRGGTRDNLVRDLESLYDFGFILECYDNNEIMTLRKNVADHLIMALLTLKEPYPYDDLVKRIDLKINELNESIKAYQTMDKKRLIGLYMFMYNEINPLYKYACEYYLGRKKE